MRAGLVLRDPTIDLDASDVVVYGRTKRGVSWRYARVRSVRVHLASGAAAELPLAAELTAGNDDVRPRAGALLTGLSRCPPSRRSAAGAGCGPTPATSTPRRRPPPSGWAATSRSRRSGTRLPGGRWRPSPTRTGRTPVAWPARRSRPSTTLRPAGRRVSTGTYTLIRRVQVPTERLSADPRSRRTRTVAPDQLALTLGGADDAEDVWAVSFILTNIPASHGDTVWM